MRHVTEAIGAYLTSFSSERASVLTSGPSASALPTVSEEAQ